jgi:hypothetical protein
MCKRQCEHVPGNVKIQILKQKVLTLKAKSDGWVWWVTPGISATQEVKIRRIKD